ncbi:MAG: helix-turn-helix domain-containing protein [Marinoscillum sp.]
MSNDREPDLNNPVSMDAAFIRKLESILEEHISNKEFGVDELSTEIGMSRSQLHRKLQSITRQSTSRFIRSYRLNKARHLLENKAGRISEISEQTGFSSPAYFSQVFTEEFGFAPREAEKQLPKTEQPSTTRHPKTRILILTGILIIVLGVTIWWFISPEEANPKSKSIAVLPFQNMTNNSENEYLADGITEDIISQLAQLQDLKVISRTSSMQYKNTNLSIPQIANQLGVSTILEGSIRLIGDQLRVAAQLIDAKEDAHLWSETYDRQIGDILSMQLEVATSISKKLDIYQKEPLEVHDYLKNVAPETYDLYMKARFLEYQFSKEISYMNIKLYEDIIDRDPGFGPAYSGIAACYIILGTWHSHLSAEAVLQGAKPSLKKAFELAPDFFHTHAVDGNIKFFFEWDFKGAEESFIRAINLDPSYPIVQSVYHHYLNMMGRYDDAIRQWKKLNEIDPTSMWSKAFHGETLVYQGKYEDAVRYCKQVLEEMPVHPVLHDKLGWAYVHADSLDQAIAVFENAFELFDMRPASMLSYLAIAYHRKGNVEKASEVIQELISSNKSGQPNTAGWVAVYYSGIKDVENAFKWLMKAYEAHDVEMIWLLAEPQYRNIAHDPRYDELVRKVGFPD